MLPSLGLTDVSSDGRGDRSRRHSDFLTCLVPEVFFTQDNLEFITLAVAAGEVIRIFQFIVSTSPQKGDGACVGDNFCLKTKISLIIRVAREVMKKMHQNWEADFYLHVTQLTVFPGAKGC